MSIDATEPQGGPERRRSQEISLQRERPPLEVPGYTAERYLGMGAYGEVWVACERNTGRRVAIKFYTHRGGLDWSLLSREVEKLAFLFADRYVVQLLNVGWESEPPYYIMEYLDRGSLADRLSEGPLRVREAVDLFRHVAIGLGHAHDKGVLHCDLKPANILLDQDGKPRLADFGQSRLSDDQTPALGTLFYMAPEQAKLTEAPSTQWDVYALGAVVYCMLTGRPPHWSDKAVEELEATDDLKKRLNLYRRMIHRSPPASGHRRVRGVDRDLADIIDRCLAPHSGDRYPNIQAVLGALDARDKRRSQRPVMLLGAIGPALLLVVVAWFAVRGFGTSMRKTELVLTERALQTNEFLADNLAKLTSFELSRRVQAVTRAAASTILAEAMLEKTGPNSELRPLLEQLADPSLPLRDPLRRDFRENNKPRAQLQEVFAERVAVFDVAETSGWFLTDALGNQVARVPENRIIGRNYAWRTYFTAREEDMPPDWRPETAGEHITAPHISAVYRSQATNRWMVSIAAPIFSKTPERTFLGTVAVMVEVGQFVQFEGENPNQFAALVDWRKGPNRGLVVQHPELDKLLRDRDEISEPELRSFLVELNRSPDDPGRLVDYYDPLLPEVGNGWLAKMAPVNVGDQAATPDDCLVVVVQERYRQSIGLTLDYLKQSLVRYGVTALALIVVVMVGLWTLVIRMFRDETSDRTPRESEPSTERSTPRDASSGVTPTEPVESA
ncbi:MAG: protein kinase [Pirellulaceae bacterium]|nr:protein kinase [Pirellulaceae bacterium]